MPNRSLVHGFGINDADYPIAVYIDGKQIICQFYSLWKDMIRRGYSKEFKSKNPAYIDCSVCEEWKYFSKFKSWMETQDWQGKQLDKDILVHGNKIYSPETCIFVSKSVNVFFTCDKSKRGDLPTGLSRTNNNTFRVSISIDKKRIHVGTYKDPLEAFKAWAAAKLKQAHVLAEENPQIGNALILKTEQVLQQDYVRAIELIKELNRGN